MPPPDTFGLDELGAGEDAVLAGFDPALPHAWRERFEDLGFTPETVVARERRAPLGDPVAFRVRGTLLCLRRAEARFVRMRRPARP